MITEMIDKLVADAAEEADHKAWCDKETAETQEKIDDHTATVEKLTAKIDKVLSPSLRKSKQRNCRARYLAPVV